MRYRTLGRTGYRISEVGFGAWGLGRQMWVGAEDGQSLQALHAAADRGLNFIDTALVYGSGHSEKLIGRFLKERSERIHVASKIPPFNLRWPASGTLEEVFPADHIIRSTERSLANLGVDCIDLMQLHVWDPAWTEEEQWHETLCALREEGKIARFGVSINDHQPDSALGLVGSGKVDSVQVIYNIFDQSPEEKLFPACQKMNVGVIVRVPFDEGALTGNITPETTFPKKDWRNLYFAGNRKREVFDRVQRLLPLLGNEDRTLPQLALAFCLHHPAVTTVIPGMRSLEHVAANMAVSDQPSLSTATIEKLRQHLWPKNFYPT